MERMIDTRRPSSPFDDGAAERLRRMGLLQERDKPDRESMAVLCCVYAGLLFDDMCDFYQDYSLLIRYAGHLIGDLLGIRHGS